MSLWKLIYSYEDRVPRRWKYKPLEFIKLTNYIEATVNMKFIAANIIKIKLIQVKNIGSMIFYTLVINQKD